MKDLADPTTAALTVADALERAGLRAAVYGGLALAAYGEPRETKDADFAVASTDAEATLAALRTAGIDASLGFTDVRFGGNDLTRFTLFGAVEMTGLNVLDLVRPRSVRYGTGVLARSLTGRLGGSAVRIVSPEDFVILKILSTRERDLEDAASVVRELAGRLDTAMVAHEVNALAKEIGDHDVLARWARASAIARGGPEATPARESDRADEVAAAIRTVAARHADELSGKRTRGEAEAREDGFLWKCLLRGYATLGRAEGWTSLVSDPAREGAVSFAALAALRPDERVQVAERVFLESGVRYHRRKAEWLSAAHERVTALGGPSAASRRLATTLGRDAKMRFLKEFPGVGPKYARNLMMDLHDPDFRQSIAIDSRILAFARDVGLTIDPGQLEQSLLAIAGRAGLDGWTCDRVLFGWSDEVRGELRLPATARKSRRPRRS